MRFGIMTPTKKTDKVKLSVKRETMIREVMRLSCILDCTKAYSTQTDLDHHMEIGDHNGAFFFTCQKCPKKFASTKLLKTHICDLTAGQCKEFKIEKEIIRSDPKVNPIKVKKGSPKKGLPQQKHEDVNETSSCQLYSCQECGRSLPSSESLDIHIQIHAELRIQACKANDCGALFSTQKELWEHKAKGHQQIKARLECEVCQKSCTDNHALKNHMLRHNTEKNFICQCGKAFKKKDSLKSHMAMHKGVPDFHCDQCGLKFYAPSGLSNHKKNKHGESQIQTCEQCGKVCLQKYALARHMTLHTGERRFKCGHVGCGKGFRDGQTKNNHERLHRGAQKVLTKQTDPEHNSDGLNSAKSP